MAVTNSHYEDGDTNGTPSRSTSMPIAIVGMSCRFSGDATNLDKLWELCANARDGWSPIPKDRFNQKAFFHPNGNKLGCINVEGAHFLKEDIALFDASFFGFTTDLASNMDPQVRLQLESAYEALENAGISLQRIAGSNTSVYVASFYRDYSESLIRDPDQIPRSFLTGTSPAMLSNRISHFFDLRGPSMTVDTGCSGSLTALHLACQSLRTGEAKVSVVGGSNVLLNPDTFIYMTNLGFLSADGRCYAWDDRASGYARGEGVATIVLKPLEDALRDGDNIHAVIRETALSQDGKTPTITKPSPEAQEDLIRDCYQRAGLDPRDTGYVEAHMTGTQAGDPIEANSIGKVFGENRAPGSSLLVGSIKPNLGHMETASGLASVIKVVLALQKGKIPPNVLFNNPNPKIPLDQLGLKVPLKLESWPEEYLRRASINNFGYGGANAHVIVDHPKYHTRQKETSNGVNGVNGTNGVKSTKNSSRIFVLSGKDSNTTQAILKNLKDYLQKALDDGKDVDLDDLAYTLSERRTIFPWTATVIASNLPELIKSLGETKPKQASKDVLRLGFIFNGQGAQWYGMGRELIHHYPVFESAIMEADAILKEFGAEWSLLEELQREESTSRVNELAMSQPMCVAVQICLVRLLTSWGIQPSAVTSHSSGEVAAAYAAGAITFKEALGIMYFRAVTTCQYAGKGHVSGGMLAAGLSEDEAEEYIARVTAGHVVVACINSPSSVTISGDLPAIDELEKILNDDKVFARKLKVATAYHSHHMDPVAAEYLAALEPIISRKGTFNGVAFASPVTGRLIPSAKELGPNHWVKNLLQPVLFLDALQTMCFGAISKGSSQTLIDALVEVGPHGALGGPVRQTLTAPGYDKTSISYGSCLMRKQNAVSTMQTLAASLFQQGYPVDLTAVNFPDGNKPKQVLADLPPYPWNHSVRYWTESRLNIQHRKRETINHDLLGTRLIGSNDQMPVWRNFIRTSDVPWVRDHQVQSDIVYPAAGCIAMAIEGARQYFPLFPGQEVAGYRLREIEITTALVIPDSDEGVEVQLSFRECSNKELDSDGWEEFRIHSVSNDGSSWIEHCKGFISRELKSSRANGLKSASRRASAIGNSHSQLKEIEPEAFFTTTDARELKYGPAFRNLVSMHANDGESLATISLHDIASVMPSRFYQPHLIHPTTLDTIFQVVLAALPDDAYGGATCVPRSIKNLYVSQDIDIQAGKHFQVHAAIDERQLQGFHTTIMTSSETNTGSFPVVEVEGMFFQSLNNLRLDNTNTPDQNTCFKLKWHPDLALSTKDYLRKALCHSVDPSEVHLNRQLQRATYYLLRDALSHLTEKDVSNMNWYHQKMYSWMKGYVARIDLHGLEQPLSAVQKQQLYDEVSAQSINGKMTCLVGESLVPILRKQVAPLELMMQDKLLNTYYEQLLRSERSYAQVKQLVQLVAAKNPRARVLEIGAGTGGCTSSILEGLSGEYQGSNPQFSHFDFTDISPGFLESARQRLANWGDMISYQTLDIESDPEEQSFEPHSYDLIVACQCLHATKSVVQTLTNVRKLLKPGGKLILMETTRDVPDTQLVFGTLPGWWLSTEPERKLSPTVNINLWQESLKQSGFNGIDVDVPDCENPEHYSFSVILATATSAQTLYPENVTIVYANSPPPHLWLDTLKAQITDLTSSVPRVESLSDLDPDGNVCIFLGEVDQALLDKMAPSEYEAIKRMTTRAKGVLWVSHGAGMGTNKPEHLVHAGFLRTLRMEDRSKRYIMVNLDSAKRRWGDESAKTIVDIFRASFDYNQKLEEIDTEYLEKGPVIEFSRLYEDLEENNATSLAPQSAKPHLEEFVQDKHPLTLDTKTGGLLENLHFIDDLTHEDPLPEEYVEVKPEAFGLNFRDVLVATGQLKAFVGEFSGVVTRLGSRTSESGLSVGDRIMSPGVGSWSNSVRLHWTNLARIPDDMTFEEAASIPTVYVTAYYSLVEIARMEKNETVLIHAATGGVGQAAINVAKHVGAEIFVTVSTKEKREFVMENYGIPADHIFSSRDISFAEGIMAMTNGRGVDVVLNSLAGPLLKHTWECIAQFGRFIEIGKRDILASKHLNLAPMDRVASFSAVDIKQLGEHKGHIVHRVMQKLLMLMKHKSIKPVKPITTYAISDLESAFRLMQAGKHLGKVVIKPHVGDKVKVYDDHTRALFSPEKTYLIVGGLGGIGRSMAKRMVQLKARNLVLASRSAETQEDCLAFRDELEGLGCNILLQNCDVSSAADVNRMIAKAAQSLPPIRGVIQAAVVLQDSVFESMTFEQWTATVKPKMQGTWNLHAALPDLDFLVMLSSLTGVFGNASQAAYTAANTYLDGVAKYRTALGLPAISINLGGVKSVGIVSRRQDVADRLDKIGYEALEEEKVLKIIESAIRRPSREVDTCQIITGIRSFDKNSDVAWTYDMRFASIEKRTSSTTTDGPNSNGGKNSQDIFNDLLPKAATIVEAVDLITTAMVFKLSDMFSIPEADIDISQSMSHYGVDSLVAIEVRNWLTLRAQAEMSIFDVLQSASLTGLAEKVAAKSKVIKVT